MIKAGEKLKEERLKKDLSLDDISKSTKIKSIFLEYIEEGEYHKLPSASYVSGFVKNYARFLGLDEKEVMAIFRREYDEEKAFKVLPGGFEQKDDFPIFRFRNKRFVVLAISIFAIFILYILFQYRYAFLNPPLEVSNPKENDVINSSQVRVSGKTDPNSTVYLNKDLISVDQNGNFEKTIIVFPGKTVIVLKAVSKFLKETEKRIDIEVKGGS